MFSTSEPRGSGCLSRPRESARWPAALALAFLGHRRHKGRLLFASRWLLVLGVALLGLSRSTLLSMVALAVAGVASISQAALTNTLIQLAVPDELRGRVVSAYAWALGGFWPLGSLLIGALGDWLGAGNALLLTAGGALALTVFSMIEFPELVRLK